MKRTIVAVLVLVWLVAVLCDPGGLILMVWTSVAGVITAAFVMGHSHGRRSRAVRAGVVLFSAVVVGYVGPDVGTTADFYLRYSRYSRAAAAALEAAQQDARPDIVAVPDARDSWYWYVYDRGGLGRHGFTGLPHGRCRAIATHWTHCATS